MLASAISGPSTVLRQSLLRPLVRGVRALSVTTAAEWQRQGRGPRVAFLPSRGRQQSSLLRIYNMAPALRSLGWQSLVLPWKLTLRQRMRLLGRFHPHVIVMQGVRHDLNRPGLYPDWPIVLDVDDADFHLDHLVGPVTRAMSQVAGVIAGSRYIATWCQDHGVAADVIWSAAPVSRRRHVPQKGRSPVVAWAQTAPATYTDEANWVLDVMRQLKVRHPDVCLRLYDRKPGDTLDFLNRFRQSGIRTEWCASARYRDYLASFDDVAVGLAPLSSRAPFSRGKSFGKVLAYLDRQVPVVGSDAGEHAAFFGPNTGVISNDPKVWVVEAADLLQDPDRRTQISRAAYQQFQRKLTIPAAARRLDRTLCQYLA